MAKSFHSIRKFSNFKAKQFSKYKRRGFIQMERILTHKRKSTLKKTFLTLKRKKKINFIDMNKFRVMMLLLTIDKTFKKYDKIKTMDCLL